MIGWFKNFLFDNDYNFLFEIINMSPNVEVLEIFCSPNYINPLQKKFRQIIKKKYLEIKFNDFKEYNDENNDVNHDRFIIINTDEISIRFTTSFNNLRQNEDGSYYVKDSFAIVFTRGREYYD